MYPSFPHQLNISPTISTIFILSFSSSWKLQHELHHVNVCLRPARLFLPCSWPRVMDKGFFFFLDLAAMWLLHPLFLDFVLTPEVLTEICGATFWCCLPKQPARTSLPGLSRRKPACTEPTLDPFSQKHFDFTLTISTVNFPHCHFLCLSGEYCSSVLLVYSCHMQNLSVWLLWRQWVTVQPRKWGELREVIELSWRTIGWFSLMNEFNPCLAFRCVSEADLRTGTVGGQIRPQSHTGQSDLSLTVDSDRV